MSGRVLVVGDIATDILAGYTGELAIGSDTAARVRQLGGGSAANTAAWLAALGRPVTLVGAVGADAAGTARLHELRAAGVRCAVRVVPGADTGTVVVLSHARERTMLCDRGANTQLSTMDVDGALAESPDAVHLHLSGYALFDPGSRAAGLRVVRAGRDLGLTTSVDAASAGPLRRVGGAAFLAWIAGTDLLLANEQEAGALLDRPAGDPGTPAELAIALARRVRYAVVKSGRDGAVLAAAGEPPVPVAAQSAATVDPTGAGDAFAAGLLHSWLDGYPLPTAGAAGARLGALAVGITGGRPAGPVPR